MKLPSFTYLLHSAGRSFLRFPLTMLSALTAVTLGIYLYEQGADSLDLRQLNIMLCAALGISVFFCATVFSDIRGYGTRPRVVLHLVAALVLVALYFTLPDSMQTLNNSLPYIRYTVYSIAMHLLVAVVPYMEKGKLNGFWHYNRILFVRFLTALLYAGFLYTGLALALGSLDFLFDIDLHRELFFDLFILIGGLFNTWFFIAGIPEDFHALDSIEEYPKGIKIFSQYVLLPLLILYLVILYAYTGKIIVLWSWPKGLVPYLVSCVAVLGILTILLIHPYSSLPGNAWIKKFSRTYYFILFPLVVLLFIAIGMRVGDYGITIKRYLIVLLGIWLTIVCFYFSLGGKNIKFVPASLALILLLMSFGPWGMFSVSEHSQVDRLKGFLEQYKILQDGKIKGEVIWPKDTLELKVVVGIENVNEGIMPDSVHNEVRSILQYLDDHHGFVLIRDWYKQDIDSIIRVQHNHKKRWYRIAEAEAYMRSMGLKYAYLYDSEYDYRSFSREQFEDSVTDVRGFDYLINLRHYDNLINSRHYDDLINSRHYDDDREHEFYVGKSTCHILFPRLSTDPLKFIADKDTLVFRTDSLITRLISRPDNYDHGVPSQEMSLRSVGHGWQVKLEVEELNLKIEHDSTFVNDMDIEVLIRKP